MLLGLRKKAKTQEASADKPVLVQYRTGQYAELTEEVRADGRTFGIGHEVKITAVNRQRIEVLLHRHWSGCPYRHTYAVVNAGCLKPR